MSDELPSLAVGAFVLPDDATLTQAEDFTPDLRRQLGLRRGDAALSRARARVSTQLLDRNAARIVSYFRQPRTVAAAVLQFSSEVAQPPETILWQAYPALQRLVQLGLLVPEGSHLAKAIVPIMASGDSVGRFTLEDCIQATVDTDVYRARSSSGNPVLVKLARAANERRTADRLRHEARILKGLRGRSAPRLIDEGRDANRRYLVTEWVHGIRLDAIAPLLSQPSEAHRRNSRFVLAVRIAERYAALHGLGICHGDAHPGNIIVRPDGTPVLIDFGFALRHKAAPSGVGRGISIRYCEPEYAARAMRGLRPPDVTPLGEQYAVGALLFAVFTDAHYLDLHPDRRRMLQQVIADRPRPFADTGAASWPAVERAIQRALSKSPGSRHRSMRAFATALSAAAQAPGNRATKRSSIADRVISAAELTAEEQWPEARTRSASLNGGSAGTAIALHRIACARDDARVESLAVLWASHAVRESARRRAFPLPELGADAVRVPRGSLYHGQPGVWVAQATFAAGNDDAVDAAVRRFLSSAEQKPHWNDIGFGRAGLLLGAATLLACGIRAGRLRQRLIQAGDAHAAALHRLASPGAKTDLKLNWGIAHGWAGVAYALLRWSMATSRPPSPALHSILARLARAADQARTTARWRWTHGAATRHGEHRFMAGWCNGSAGFVQLWIAASTAGGSARYEALAIAAGRHVWAVPGRPWDLCCGLGGEAYAMLALYRHTGETLWLRRAQRLGERAQAAATAADNAMTVTNRLGLMQGIAGIAVLAEELRDPAHARMPVFETQPAAGVPQLTGQP